MLPQNRPVLRHLKQSARSLLIGNRLFDYGELNTHQDRNPYEREASRRDRCQLKETQVTPGISCAYQIGEAGICAEAVEMWVVQVLQLNIMHFVRSFERQKRLIFLA